MTATYKKDILPLFRPQDIQCMSRAQVSLGEADWMLDTAGNGRFPDHANARVVGERIANKTMPPDAPWPADRIALYQDWIEGGFQP